VAARLYTGRDVDPRLRYDGAYGGTVISHGGSVVISARFRIRFPLPPIPLI
jgi:hypothetical protein